MKKTLTLIILLTSLLAMAQDGKATTIKKTFNRTTTISQTINADASVIWSLLTNATDISRWNSTVVFIEGNIIEGEKIRLISSLDSSKMFILKIKEMTNDEKLVWGNGFGERTYILENKNDVIYFTMTEKIGGFIFPLFAKKIPSFDESFEQFTADLKKEAESKKTPTTK